LDGALEGKDGLKTVVAGLHDPAAPVPGAAGAEQLTLLPVQAGASGAKNSLPAGRGRGRPPGAKNKNSKEWAEYLLSQYRSPLVMLAETFNRSAVELAGELECSVLEAFKVQLVAAKELAPYIHQKQPQAIDLGDSGLIQLTINAGHAAMNEAQKDGIFSMKFIDGEDKENQEVIEGDFQESNAGKSNVSAETGGNTGEAAAKPSDSESHRGGGA
jgi:hypothetical protein